MHGQGFHIILNSIKNYFVVESFNYSLTKRILSFCIKDRHFFQKINLSFFPENSRRYPRGVFSVIFESMTQRLDDFNHFSSFIREKTVSI